MCKTTYQNVMLLPDGKGVFPERENTCVILCLRTHVPCFVVFVDAHPRCPSCEPRVRRRIPLEEHQQCNLKDTCFRTNMHWDTGMVARLLLEPI